MEEKIGVYLCECGPNIADNINLDKVRDVISFIPGVTIVERHKLLCSEDGKKFLKESIQKQGVTRLVIAACSPKQHEVTFMKVCTSAGLNPHLFQLANIREQCAWIIEDKELATERAIRYIRAALRRIPYHTPLEKKEIDANSDVLVIGGGITGIETSLLLARGDRKVYLIEKTNTLGGKVKELFQLLPRMEASSDIIAQKIKQAESKEGIKIFTNSEVEEVIGFFGNFIVKVRTGENTVIELKVGAIVVAIGFDMLDIKQIPRYGYGKYANVYTALEFEKMCADGKIILKDGKLPSSIAIIHCVGREERGYCSGVCCMYCIKFANYITSLLPSAKVTEVYQELSIPGKSYQEFYKATKSKGVEFIRYSEVEVRENEIRYKTEDGEEKFFSVDMVVLAPAIEPCESATKLAKILKLSQGEAGFFREEHPKLAPVSTSIEGIYIAGCAQGPKNIPESIVQAQAVAGRILSSLIPGKKLEPEVRVSEISEAFCIGCQTCVTVCTYGAIYFDEIRRVSVVNEVLCRGCGNCTASCPSGAASLKHFTTTQLYQEVVEALR